MIRLVDLELANVRSRSDVSEDGHTRTSFRVTAFIELFRAEIFGGH